MGPLLTFPIPTLASRADGSERPRACSPALRCHLERGTELPHGSQPCWLPHPHLPWLPHRVVVLDKVTDLLLFFGKLLVVGGVGKGPYRVHSVRCPLGREKGVFSGTAMTLGLSPAGVLSFFFFSGRIKGLGKDLENPNLNYYWLPIMVSGPPALAHPGPQGSLGVPAGLVSCRPPSWGPTSSPVASSAFSACV